MPRITFIPAGKIIDADEGESIRDAALRAGVEIVSPCLGYGICGKCLVRIASGDVSGEVDDRNLSLACRSFPLSDCVVEVPSTLEMKEVQALGRVGRGALKWCDLDPPAFSSGLTDGDALGVAIDLGTTSIVAALASLASGEIESVSSRTNPQARFGDDVISRIGHAGTPGGLSELQKAVVECLNELIDELAEKAAARTEKIADVVVSGNATMMHLLLGISPARLGTAPYEPAFRTHDPVPLQRIGITGNTEAKARLLPNIAGFVGGDTVAGILATGMHRSATLRIFIDIGTNGEIAVGNSRRLVASSAAAGPALEGGRIEKGMRAVEGAIDHVRIDDDVRVSTIGGGPPGGICGSGVIEAVAGMLSAGLIHPDGRLATSDEILSLPDALARRLDGVGAKRRFVLSSTSQGPIYLTQKDITEVQLAKGAIRAATEILLEEWGAGIEDVAELLVAGAFGYHLGAREILRIGLIPSLPAEKVSFVGNTSLEGALGVLLSRKASDEAFRIADDVEFVELANRQDFQDAFVRSLAFPF